MPAACTIVTRSHLAQARVVASSFVQRHPDATFVTLVLDDEDRTIGADEPFDVARPDDVGIDRAELHRRGAMFGPHGLASSTKSVLLRHLVGQHGTAVYLDADSCVYAEISHVFELARRHGVVLTPNLAWPLSTADAGYPLEETFLKYSVFNGGFVAAGEPGAAFLDWWCDRSSRHCVEAPEQGYIYSEKWLTIVPAFFDHHVLHDPGINVLWWNLYDRDVEWRGSTPTISGGPLRHFHFMGLDPANPVKLGSGDEATRARFPGFERRPGTARLCREYAASVRAAGLDEARRTPPPYVRLPDGQVFSDEARTRYREAVEGAEASGAPEPSNPFER
ncbi:MAG TPA: hypothetical protein VIH82_11580 [Acidimicrobiia bacterium]